MVKCHLCQTNEADKKNSHTIPKFFSRTMLRQDDGKNLGYKMSYSNGDADMTSQKIQDIHKQDFIFCSECEEKLSKLETAFANKLYKRLGEISSTTKEGALNVGKIDVGSIEEIKSLIYSIAWRVNLNSNEYPESNLSSTLEEKLRKILQKEMIDNGMQIFIMYGKDVNPNANIVNVIQHDIMSGMILNDIFILVIFDTNQYTIPNFPSSLYLKDNNCPIIILRKQEWEAMIKFFITSSIKWVNGK